MHGNIATTSDIIPRDIKRALDSYLAGDTGSAIRIFVSALGQRGIGPAHAARAMASFKLTLAKCGRLGTAISAAAWELEDVPGRSPIWEEIGIVYDQHAIFSDYAFVANRRARV